MSEIRPAVEVAKTEFLLGDEAVTSESRKPYVSRQRVVVYAPDPTQDAVVIGDHDGGGGGCAV